MTSAHFDAIASALHGPKVVDIFEGCMRAYGYKRTDVLGFFEMIANGDVFEAEMPRTWKTVNTKFSKIYTLRQACAVPVLSGQTQQRALAKLDDILKKMRDQKKARIRGGGDVADTVADTVTDTVAVPAVTDTVTVPADAVADAVAVPADDVDARSTDGVASVSLPEYTWRTEQERARRALANAREAEAVAREAEARVRMETEFLRSLELRVKLAEFQARKQEAYVRRLELSSREKMILGRPSGHAVVERDEQ